MTPVIVKPLQFGRMPPTHTPWHCKLMHQFNGPMVGVTLIQIMHSKIWKKRDKLNIRNITIKTKTNLIWVISSVAPGTGFAMEPKIHKLTIIHSTPKIIYEIFLPWLATLLSWSILSHSNHLPLPKLNYPSCVASWVDSMYGDINEIQDDHIK